MDKQPYNALDVAQVVLDYYRKNGVSITNLGLQKVLFFIQWYSLKNENKPFFKDEIEAWQHGPVVPNVYHKCKTYVDSPIDDPIGESDNVGSYKNNLKEKLLLKLKKYPDWKLVGITHRKNTSWKKAMRQGGNGTIISWDFIKEDNYSF